MAAALCFSRFPRVWNELYTMTVPSVQRQRTLLLIGLARIKQENLCNKCLLIGINIWIIRINIAL